MTVGTLPVSDSQPSQPLQSAEGEGGGLPSASDHAAQADAVHFKAAGAVCHASAPDLFFASSFLPQPIRGEVRIVFAVLHQLDQVLTPKATGASGEQAGGCEGCGGQQSSFDKITSTAESLDAGEAARSSSDPASRIALPQTGAGSAAVEPAAPAPAQSQGSPGGCDDCPSQETMEKRREVCSSVLAFLYSGQPTGRAELDGFLDVATRHQLPRAWFETWADGRAALLGASRIATWGRMHDLLKQTAGAAALIVWRMLAEEEASAEDPREKPNQSDRDTLKALIDAHPQPVSVGVAIGLCDVLCHLPTELARGRVPLPIADLVKSGVSDRELAGLFASETDRPEQRAAYGRCDDWRKLISLEVERARNLLRGGVRRLESTESDHLCRAAAVLASLCGARLDALDRSPAKALMHPPRLSMWRRLSRLPQALRLAMRPDRASAVL